MVVVVVVVVVAVVRVFSSPGPWTCPACVSTAATARVTSPSAKYVSNRARRRQPATNPHPRPRPHPHPHPHLRLHLHTCAGGGSGTGVGSSMGAQVQESLVSSLDATANSSEHQGLELIGYLVGR